MQIKEHKILSVELSESSELGSETIEKLYRIVLWDMVPGGELCNEIEHEITYKSSLGNRRNAIIQAAVPSHDTHIKNERYTPEKFETAIRESFGILQGRIKEYNKFLDFKRISEEQKK